MTRRLRRVVAACLAGLMILSTGEQILAAGPADSSAAAVDAQLQENASAAENTGDNTKETEGQAQTDDTVQTDDADQTDDAVQTDGSTLSEAPASGDGQADTSDGKTDDPSESEPADWSSRKDAFLFSYEQLTQDEEDGWTLSVQFSFPLKDTEETVREGDTAVLQLPTEWMEIEDTKEKASLSPFIEKTDGEEKTEEAVDVPIAEYEIKDGTVKLTFTDGIESDEIVSQITELKTRLTVPFIWKEGVQTEEEQQVTWTLQTYEDDSKNEADLVIPALEKEQDEKQSDEKKTEEKKTEKSVNTAALLGATTLADIDFGGYTLVNDNSLKYNNNSQDRDIYWIDNNNGQGKRPARDNVQKYFTNHTEALAVNGVFTYTDTEGTTHQVTLQNIPYSSVTAASSDIALTDLGGTGHWSLRVSDLLSDGKLIIDGQTYTGTFSDWELVYADPSTLDEVASEDGYAAVLVTSVNDEGTPVDQAGRERVSATGKPGWYFVEETNYVANISARCGTTNFDTELVKTAIENNYSFTWKTGLKDADGNDLNKGSFPLSSQEGWLTFDWVDDPNVKGELLYGTAAVKGLERFNLDGSELIFNIDGTANEGAPVKITEIKDKNQNNILTDGDYLAESIENNAVSNWGTNVDQVYSGGTLILTLTGTTEYTATKEWQDKDKDENTVRPQADFYLWRFTKTSEEDDYLKTAYQTASPVKDTGGQTAQFTISAGSTTDSQTIDFSSEFGNNQKDYLPKYDQEGFEYIYLSREYMSGKDVDKYKTVYGKVSEDNVDVINDTLIYDGERTSIDNSIYNEGTVSNMLSGNTTAGVTKTWEAAYFQSELTDVTVELTLQKSDDDGRTWTNTETVYTMGKTNPFYAEFLSQSHSETMPKYDNYGRLLQYRWIESAVYQGEDSTSNLLPDPISNPMTFTLTQNGQQVEYTSTATVTPDGNGNYYTEIINKIEDETEYYVRKEWGQNVTSEPVDLIIYRTNALNQQQMLLPGGGQHRWKIPDRRKCRYDSYGSLL